MKPEAGHVLGTRVISFEQIQHRREGTSMKTRGNWQVADVVGDRRLVWASQVDVDEQWTDVGWGEGALPVCSSPVCRQQPLEPPHLIAATTPLSQHPPTPAKSYG